MLTKRSRRGLYNKRRKLAKANQRLMSVVIVGGNECMTRRYIDICKEYNCRAKVFPKPSGGLRNIGSPDLLVLFTNTVSHKMVKSALDGTRGCRTAVARSHSSSAAALRSILEEHSS